MLIRFLIRYGWLALLAMTLIVLLKARKVEKPRFNPDGQLDTVVTVAETSNRISHRFRVINQTSKTISVHKIDVSCICTKSELGKFTLVPGEETFLLVEMHLSQAVTDRTVACTLRTDCAERPNWKYRLRLQTFPAVTIEPSVLNLGKLEADQGGQTNSTPLRVLTFGRAGELPPDVQSISCPDTRVTLRHIDTTRQEITDTGVAAVEHVYSVRVLPSKVPGVQVAPISVCLTDKKTATGKVAWECLGSITAVPSFAHFGTVVAKGSSHSCQLLLRSHSDRPISVKRVRTVESNPVVSIVGNVLKDDQNADLPKANDEATPSQSPVRLELTLTLTNGSTSRALTGVLAIMLDSPEETELLVPWSAFVQR